MNNCVLLFFLMVSNTVIGQISFTKEIAPIIFSNCSYCHNKSGYTPFTLVNYEDIAANIYSIKYVVNNKIMPPWKPSEDDHKFLNERQLSESEINLLNDWITQGYKCDDKNLVYKKNGSKQVFGGGLGKPDLILKPTEPYTTAVNSKDAFVSYIMNTGIKSYATLKAVVLKPGPSKIVHHARLEYDSLGLYEAFGKLNTYFETPVIPDSMIGSIPPVGFYVPGLDHIMFPKGSGYPINPKGKFVLFLHYSPTAKTEKDQTEVWLYFNKKPIKRVVSFRGYEYNIRNTNIPKDSFTAITDMSDPIMEKFTLTAVEPHLHLLGQSFKVEIIRNNNADTTLLINLPNWDFNWQEVYLLKKPIILNVGDRLLINVTFDNTRNNPKNPFFPPRDVTFGGMATTNEMINFIMIGLHYQEGDENLELSY